MSLLVFLVALWLALLAWRRRQIAIPHWKPLAWTAAGGFLLGFLLLIADLEGQKLAVRLFSPLGLVWIVLAAAALAALRDREWRQLAILGGCWLLLSLGCNAWFGAWLIGRLESSLPTPEAAVKWDAACVLGGGTGLDPDGRPQLAAAGDRLRVAAQMWWGGRVPLLTASGSGLIGSEADRDLASETIELWEKSWDVPAAAIVRLPGPLVNTRQEVKALAELARARGWRRVALISSAWHLPRAMALARTFGLPADPVGCDWRGSPPPVSPIFLVPSFEGAESVLRYLNEMAGRAVGR